MREHARIGGFEMREYVTVGDSLVVVVVIFGNLNTYKHENG